MAVSIDDVMRSCCNFFERGYRDGTFSIAGNVLSPTVDGGYVYLSGTKHSDGAYRLGVSGQLLTDDMLEDETFTGRVWALNPPPAFLALCEEIKGYEEKNPAGSLQSESFGAYSYSRASGANGTATWQEAFSSRLACFRRMFTEVG